MKHKYALYSIFKSAWRITTVLRQNHYVMLERVPAWKVRIIIKIFLSIKQSSQLRTMIIIFLIDSFLDVEYITMPNKMCDDYGSSIDDFDSAEDECSHDSRCGAVYHRNIHREEYHLNFFLCHIGTISDIDASANKTVYNKTSNLCLYNIFILITDIVSSFLSSKIGIGFENVKKLSCKFFKFRNAVRIASARMTTVHIARIMHVLVSSIYSQNCCLTLRLFEPPHLTHT